MLFFYILLYKCINAIVTYIFIDLIFIKNKKIK